MQINYYQITVLIYPFTLFRINIYGSYLKEKLKYIPAGELAAGPSEGVGAPSTGIPTTVKFDQQNKV